MNATFNIDFYKSKKFFKKGKLIMSNISILKIESEKGTLLVSRNANQEIFPKSKIELIRNINSVPIKQNYPKLKCVIETSDIPDISILKSKDKFKVYSIIELKQYGSKTPQIDYVKDSLELSDEYIIFRPIFNMMLTNFSCSSKNSDSSPSKWKFEFEDI